MKTQILENVKLSDLVEENVVLKLLVDTTKEEDREICKSLMSKYPEWEDITLADIVNTEEC